MGRSWRVEPFNLPIAQPPRTEHHESMVTMIIAIYGAVVATASTALGAWYFLYSGPRLQAQAIVYSEKENGGEWDDDSTILLNVWNTGRAEVTMNIMYIMINHDN